MRCSPAEKGKPMATEKRLILAKELERQIKEAFKDNPYAMGQMLRWIRKQPTVDAVEVVRCNDCKHYMTIHCTCDGCCISDDWYCADGERKDNG